MITGSTYIIFFSHKIRAMTSKREGILSVEFLVTEVTYRYWFYCIHQFSNRDLQRTLSEEFNFGPYR